MNSKQRQEFLIRQLPSEVKNSLARCLDRHAENDWQMLAEHLNFSQSDIQAMERDMLGPDPISATIALLNEWQTVDPMAKVDKLFIQLGRIEKKDAMILLIPYVSPDLVVLLPQDARRAFANMHQHPTTLQTMTCVSDPFPSVVPEQSTGVKSVPTGRNRIHEEDFGTAARRLVERADALTVVASPDRNKVFDIRPDVSYDYSEMSRTPPQGIQPVDRSVISYPAGHSNTTAGGNSMPLPPSPPRNITLRPPDYVPLDRVPKAGANESPTNISLNSSSSGSDVTGNSTQGGNSYPVPGDPPTTTFQPTSLLRYSYAQLQELTNDFTVDSSSLVLGQGGFGVVHKIQLHGSYYAVKRLMLKPTDSTMLKGFQSIAEFQREFDTLSKMRSQYLVTLNGYSDDGPSPCLIYDYMVNGSLESWLFEMKPPRQLHGPLTGTERLSTALHTVKALSFLHHTLSVPVIHCNVKSSNILLGRYMEAKLADFGHVHRKSSECSVRTAIHTKSKYMQKANAYMDPDVSLGKIDPKADIYSLGMVLLEMITGMRAYDEHRKPHADLFMDAEERLVNRHSKIWQPKFIAMCDDTLDVDMTPLELVEFGDIAAACLDDRAQRPDSRQVDKMISTLQAKCAVRQSSSRPV